MSAFVGLLTVALLPAYYPSAARLFADESRFPDNFKLASGFGSLVGDKAVFLDAEFCLFGPAESGFF